MSNEYYFPARIDNREMPESVEAMLREMIKGDFGGADPYFFRAEISSDRQDSHYTHMLDNTLQNFAAEADAGVSFLDSHRRNRLAIAYTLTGSYTKSDGVGRVVSDLYTSPGINFREGTYASTDDFIRAMRASLVRKVSVGFHGGDMLCDICGGSFWNWRACKHWPGRKYTINNENGDNGDGEEVVATFGISDAHLAEVSAVYAGSTPNAMIIRAEGMAEAGLLDGDEIRRLETQYRINLHPPRTYQGVWVYDSDQNAWTYNSGGTYGTSKTLENGENQEMDELEKIKKLLDEAQIPAGEPLDKRILSLVTAFESLKDENARLVPLADQGREYRADLVKDALAEGVRALGKDFHVETYEKMFEKADIAHIKRMRDDWKRQGDLVFKGKRLTVDNEQQSTTPAPVSAVPDAAYRS